MSMVINFGRVGICKEDLVPFLKFFRFFNQVVLQVYV